MPVWFYVVGFLSLGPLCTSSDPRWS